MINKFLQFLKKQQLAIRLARFDCLFLIKSLDTFNSVYPLSRFFRRRSRLSPVLKVQSFLDSMHNQLLFAAYEEITSRSDIVPPLAYIYPLPSRELKGDALYRTAAPAKNKDFYVALFREIIQRDLPQLAPQYKVFEKRLDTIYDMRFYGSELEHLCEEAAGTDVCCLYEVDWLRTTKEKLYLCFDELCRQTARLDEDAQKNLLRLFGYLFFERSVFVSYWDSLCVNKNSQVSFLTFDAVYPAYPELKKYAAEFLKTRRRPERSEEYKISRAITLLEEFCPAIDLSVAWHEYLMDSDYAPKVQTFDNQDMLLRLKENGMSLGQFHQIMVTDPHEISYLLDGKKAKEDPGSRKSSFML